MARLVAETFEHRMHLIGLTETFEPWLKLADRFAGAGPGIGNGPGPEWFIVHALAYSGGDPLNAEHIVRSIALGKSVDDFPYFPYVREAAFAYRDALPAPAGMPRPVDPVAPKVPLTRENLWFLYRFLDLIKTEIETVTGWTRGQIDYGIRKWDLGNWSGNAIDTQWAIEECVAKVHGIPMTVENMTHISNLAGAEVKQIRELILSGEFPWESGDPDGSIRPAALLSAVEKPGPREKSA